MKLIALDLPRSMTPEELTELFTIYGQVKSADIVMDEKKRTSKGFGFIEMSNATEANAAVLGLHGRKIMKNKIRVKISK